MIRHIHFTFRSFAKTRTMLPKSSKSKVLFQTKTSTHLIHPILAFVCFNMSTKEKATKPSINQRYNATKIMQQIQEYIESAQFKKNLNCYYYVQKYSWFCIHTWLLLYKLRQQSKSLELISTQILRKKIFSLLEEYTRQQVYHYDDIFDREIYEELKRIQQVIFYSLDELYLFTFTKKSLSQTIQEDFGLIWDDSNKDQQTPIDLSQINQKSQLFTGLSDKKIKSNCSQSKQEQLKKVANYFLAKFRQLEYLSFDQIKTAKLQNWLRI